MVVPGFDEKFNAITGLNGSGKSNILDSICFVLGIQNLQQVCRAPGQAAPAGWPLADASGGVQLGTAAAHRGGPKD